MNIEFYLGGSRRMAQLHPYSIIPSLLTPETDWDYNVQDSPEINDFLTNVLGFHCLTLDDPYKDDQAVNFYKGPNNVTIITRKDLQLYKEVFDNIPVKDYVEILWKSSPHLKGKFDKARVMLYFNDAFVATENERRCNWDDIPF